MKIDLTAFLMLIDEESIHWKEDTVKSVKLEVSKFTASHLLSFPANVIPAVYRKIDEIRMR